MNTAAPPNPYAHHRFPAEIIRQGVWLYFRFCLSYRAVEELLSARGIIGTHEAIRRRCRELWQAYADQLRRRNLRPGDKWHLDDVFLTINRAWRYLGRAVDQDGYVHDILVRRRRDKKAAKKFFRKLLNGLRDVPRVIITDHLTGCGAAKREMLPGVDHRQHRYFNNRAENSHQPTRQRGGACNSLSPPDRPSASSPRMDPLAHTSAHGVICCQRARTAKRCRVASTVGPRSPARSGLPERQGGPG
jgi:putative transposase